MKIYENAISEIGEAVMIRIYRQQTKAENKLDEILQDIKFLQQRLGDIKEVFGLQAKDSYLVSLKHENKGISHISLNVSEQPIKPILKLEIAGKAGLIEYDSEKSLIFLSNPYENIYKSEDNDVAEAVKVVEAIKKSISDKLPVNL